MRQPLPLVHGGALLDLPQRGQPTEGEAGPDDDAEPADLQVLTPLPPPHSSPSVHPLHGALQVPPLEHALPREHRHHVLRQREESFSAAELQVRDKRPS